MSNANTLWEAYRDHVYSEELPLEDTQELECSRSFYAGMMACFNVVAALSNSVSDEELAAERLDDFRQSIVDAAKDTMTDGVD